MKIRIRVRKNSQKNSGGNFLGGLFFWWTIFRGAIFLGAIFQGHFTGVHFSWPMKNQQNLSIKIKTWAEIVGARNYLLEIMSLRAMILHKTDFAILTVLPCVTS